MDETIEKMPIIDLKNLDRIYVGKPNSCMCGCSGDYVGNSWNRERSGKNRGYALSNGEVDDAKTFRRLLKMMQSPGPVEVLGDYIYTMYIGTKQYTLYLFKE